ncbi:MAG: SOS response-associated peptidase family protein [Bordetella sp.]|nr:SOS response-associated peptidase family protein [Bordetella sp.]
MCYSAQVRAEYAAFQRMFPRSKLSLKGFWEIYWRRREQPKPAMRFSKAMDAMFAKPQTDEEHKIHALIEEYNAELTTATEQGLFKQRKRLADAERTLTTKVTKKAQEDQRIATNKIEDALRKLEDLRRTDLVEQDYRIFPGWWAPVLIVEEGEIVVRPMRYLCRPPGKPADYDVKFSGAYNARRDNLKSSFWKGVFGQTHAIALIPVFYENVVRHLAEHRELGPGERPENIVLEFRPQPQRTMSVACIYSHWTPPPGSDEPELWSFAAITDEPLPEVAAAGHDRTIVTLKEENVMPWLTPQGRVRAELDAMLEDKERPYYEHRMAA